MKKCSIAGCPNPSMGMRIRVRRLHELCARDVCEARGERVARAGAE